MGDWAYTEKTYYKELVAFDLDGVMAKYHPFDDQLYYEAEHNEEVMDKLIQHVSKCEPLLIPLPSYIIITCRPMALKEITITWLEKNNCNDLSLLVMPERFLHGRERWEFKANAINRLGITHYYEDELDIRAALNKEFPNAAIFDPILSVASGHAYISKLEDRVVTI